MTEYWLLKKTLGNWTKVSWWSEEEKDKAERSFESMLNSGYAIRLARIEIIKEQLLDEMMDEPKWIPEPQAEAMLKASEPIKSDWGKPDPDAHKTAVSFGGWGSTIQALEGKSEHGMSGKVWLGNPTTKEKKRVAPDEVAGMMAAGWIKAGPRTVL